MKKIYLYTIAVLNLCFGLSSCSDYLDSDRYFKDRITFEKVFKDKDYTEQWLADTYFHLTKFNQEIATKSSVLTLFASDDMYFTDQGSGPGGKYRKLKNGEFQDPDFNEPMYISWMDSYKGINKATIFLKYIHINEEMTPEEILDYKAQGRFVRAYLYWMLIRKFGPIPLLGDEELDQTISYDEMAVPRRPYDECAEYIASEMALAAKDLPLKRELRNIARPTRGAALAVRAKVLLYSASPLMNGDQSSYAAQLVDHEGKRLLPAEYDESKWAKAAAAAKDVMELNQYELYKANRRTKGDQSYPVTIEPFNDGEFSKKNWPDGYADIDPFESYRSVFNGELNAYANPELIFTRGQNQNDGLWNMVLHQLPRYTKGWNCHGTTQKQVDAYYMYDGKDCPGKEKEVGRGDGSDRVKGFVTREDIEAGRYKQLSEGVSLQYADREPRFYSSIAFNGSVWNFQSSSKQERRHQVIWYYRGLQDGRNNTVNWQITGIGIKKYVKPSDSQDEGGSISDKIPTDIRYADILLTYAEALNELGGVHQIPSWDGNQTYSISRDIKELEKGIHPIRIRGGIPDYPDDVYANKDELRKRLKRERQIEFAMEGHRYFDLRRWKDAAVEESMAIYGCNTLMTKDQTEMFHTPVAVTFLPTNFTEKTYFWPIVKSELKRNKRLTQNPGWDTYD